MHVQQHNYLLLASQDYNMPCRERSKDEFWSGLNWIELKA